MSDTRRMLAEMADPLFAELGADATMDRDGARLEQLGLPALLMPEADGGFGVRDQFARVRAGSIRELGVNKVVHDT